MIFTKRLDRTHSARWNSVDGILEVSDLNNAISMRISMEGQIELIKLLEEIIEKQPPIGPGT